MSEFRGTQNYRALFRNPLRLTQWVSHSEATPEQKALDNYIPEQGVLVPYTWKEACLNWWNANDDETKKLILGIEGFDASIFKEVTGIELNVKLDETSERIKALEEQLAQLKASIHKATE
jgi:hypothetical protein